MAAESRNDGRPAGSEDHAHTELAIRELGTFRTLDEHTLTCVFGVVAVWLLVWLTARISVGGWVSVDAPPAVDYQPMLDLNHCDWPALCLLPGIGPTLAQRIVARRDPLGGFTHLQQLRQVRGIGPRLIARMATRISLGRAVNSSRAAREGGRSQADHEPNVELPWNQLPHPIGHAMIRTIP